MKLFSSVFQPSRAAYRFGLVIQNYFLFINIFFIIPNPPKIQIKFPQNLLPSFRM